MKLPTGGSPNLLIFRQTSGLSPNSGGLNGYLWHLREGLSQTDVGGVRFYEDGAPSMCKPSKPQRSKWKPLERRIRYGISTWLYTLTGFPPWRDPEREDRRTPDGDFIAAVRSADWVHAHSLDDAANALRYIRPGTKLLVTSHSPESPALERVAMLAPRGATKRYVDLVLERLLRRDLAMFARADAWLFPSPGAMEPYIDTLPGFEELSWRRRIYFLPTGIVEPPAPTPEAIAKRRIAGKDAIQVCFVGRHEPVKGYDLFATAMVSLLEKHPDLHVVCAGGSGSVPAPSHPRWTELGRINDVQALLRASDLFVLPNRRTYYDLILIEALAAGIPVVATATGGTRDVAAETSAVRTCAPEAEAIGKAVGEFLALPAQERSEIGAEARRHYETRHTAKAFAENYLAIVRRLSES